MSVLYLRNCICFVYYAVLSVTTRQRESECSSDRMLCGSVMHMRHTACSD